MPEAYCMILTTAGSQAEANRLADVLVSSHLAACVQQLAVASVYRWQGEIHRDPEILLLVKTAARLYPRVQAAILANHSYVVPEIIQIPVTQGLDRYLDWIESNVLAE
jgi:periplasmic divalent cation tolerance protein